LADLLSNGNDEYSVGQSVGGVHEILKNGEVVGTVAGGKSKDALGMYSQQQEKIKQIAADKKLQYAENSIKNTARKNDVLALSTAMENNSDIIQNLHKQPSLEFTPLEEGIFGEKGNPLIHKSPNYGKKPGSAYELVMVNGEPAYARQSDHWGEFSTNNYVNGEPVSSNFNWPLKGVETPSFGGKSQAGYILLKDLIK
jgi:hypothetical protein